MKKIDSELHERLAVLTGAMGYELLGCELLSMGRRKMFRLFIDSPKGVSSDDCSRVGQQVGALLDVEDPFQSKYILEVSSPGIDRPLFEIAHFEKFVGSDVKMRLYAPLSGRRQFSGKLLKVEGDNIHLEVEGAQQQVVIPFDAIERANLIGKVVF